MSAALDTLRSAMSVWARLLRGGNLSAQLAAVVTISALGGLAPVFATGVTGNLTDLLVQDGEGGTFATFVLSAGLIAFSLVLYRVLPSVAAYLNGELSRRVHRAMEALLLDRLAGIHRLSPLEDPAFQNDLNLARQSGEAAPTQFLQSLTSVTQNVVSCVGFVVLLLRIDLLVAALLSAAFLPVLYANLKLARRRFSLEVSLTQTQRRQILFQALQSDVRAAQEIRLFNLHDFLRSKLMGALLHEHEAQRRLDRRELGIQLSWSVPTALLGAAGLARAVGLASTGAGTVGQVVVVVTSVIALFAVLTPLASAVNALRQSMFMLTHMDGFLSQSSNAALPAADGQREAPHDPHAPLLVCSQVSFRYSPQHPWTLEQLDLGLDRGEVLAVVGPNGAGKSTLLKLVLGLYEPTRGAIRFQGVDVAEHPPSHYCSQLSGILQDFMCYELSAAENIGIGKAGRDGSDGLLDEQDPAVVAAATRAGAHPFVENLPEGYRTLLTRIYQELPSTDGDTPDGAEASEGVEGAGAAPAAALPTGVPLSGGMWQRLALARMLIREDADLYVLDEPTAHLDTTAERHLFDLLRASDAAVLIVTHRLSTAMGADKVAFLDGGRLVETGAPQDLLDSESRFRSHFVGDTPAPATEGAGAV